MHILIDLLTLGLTYYIRQQVKISLDKQAQLIRTTLKQEFDKIEKLNAARHQLREARYEKSQKNE